MADAIVSVHWSTRLTHPVSILARIASHGYHLLRKQQLKHIRPNNFTSISVNPSVLSFTLPDLWPIQSIYHYSLKPASLSTFSSMFSLHSAQLVPADIPHSLHLSLSLHLFSDLSFLPFLVTFFFTATKYLQFP